MKLRRAGLVAGSLVVFFSACGSDDGGVAGNQVGGFSGTAGDASTDGSGASGSDAKAECKPLDVQCDGVIPKSCSLGGTWVSGAPCPFVCLDGKCTGVCAAGDTKCKLDTGLQTCGTDGKWQAATPCEFGCSADACETSCAVGEFNCYGNEVRQCDPGPPSKWVPQNPAVTCNAAAGQACDATTGTCKTLAPIGTATPTGTYYQYAVFEKDSSPFLGGFDVDSYGDYIYVNRSDEYLDVYKVVLVDSDQNGELQPNQHPLNPLATGPMEERKLEFVATYTKSGDGVPLGGSSQAELYALSDRILSLGPAHDGVISEWMMNTKTTTVVVQPTTSLPLSFMGFGDDDGLWYGGNESNRRLYSFHAPTNSWIAELEYPSLAGNHMDGMEVLVAPQTGEQYVYISDMTSDFIAQYRRDIGGWVQQALYEYGDTTSSPVEGFGFGALNHFWATSGTFLYELGGGDLQVFLDECPGGKQSCGDTEDPPCPGGQYCSSGCCEKLN